jgi:DNA-binding LacI/PurR family transcriptional regulator
MNDLTGHIRDLLIENILSGEYPPGSKLMPEREFAERFSVSRITVRRAFSQLENAGIIVRKRPSGTYVADTFQAHCGDLTGIGLITTLPHEFSGSFVEAVSNCCENEDILLALGIPKPDTAEAQLKIAERMASRGIKNLIVWGAEKTSGMQVFERLRILGVNLVFFDQVIPGSYADYVGLDNYHAVSTLFNEAVKRGCEHFIFLNFEGMNIDSNMEREAAFIRELQISGFSGEVRYLPVNCDNLCRREFTAKLLKDTTEKSAIIGTNAPIMQTLFHQDITHPVLFCVDYLPQLRELNITGYAQPIDKMAQCAVQMLKNQCRKGRKWQPVNQRFTGEIIKP